LPLWTNFPLSFLAPSERGRCTGDPLPPQCLDERHTREVRGAVMGICDSDGETGWDGQPCRRDCAGDCPEPERLARCSRRGDITAGLGEAGGRDFCLDPCVQGMIGCLYSPIFAAQVSGPGTPGRKIFGDR
jgi:hypothetical protein